MIAARRRVWPVAVVGLATLHAAAAPPEERRPPTSLHFLQYGVALTSESVASQGDVCPPSATAPCILGPGLGATIRVGYRTRGPFYLGGAYQFTRHDSSNLLRLAILQQLRGEVRYYLDQGTRLMPYWLAGLGGCLYGNEWGVQTGGATTSLGGGIEFQASESAAVGAALAWRALLLRGWTDNASERRADRYFGFGLAHLITFELVLEIRDPLPRW